MTPRPGFVTAGAPALRASAFTGRAAACSTRRPRAVVASRPTMGLFGLGLPEVAVIAGVGILIFGPSKIAELGKDLGGVAGSVKKASSEFQEAMSDSLAEADREIEERKAAKESGTPAEPELVPPEVVAEAKPVEVVDAEVEKSEKKVSS